MDSFSKCAIHCNSNYLSIKGLDYTEVSRPCEITPRTCTFGAVKRVRFMAVIRTLSRVGLGRWGIDEEATFKYLYSLVNYGICHIIPWSIIS